MLADFLGGSELLTSKAAAGRHPFRAAENCRERKFELAGGERNQFSERSQLSLLNHTPLQALEIIEALTGMLEKMKKALVHQVLFEEHEKGEHTHAGHRDHKADLA